MTAKKRASASDEEAVIEKKTEARRRVLFMAVEITGIRITIIPRAVAVPLSLVRTA